MGRTIFIFFILLIFNKAIGQGPLPADYLSKEFHAERREALRRMMPDNSVMVIFAYPERVFSNDVTYLYHPNPDLYYLSGYKEPDAVLLIFKDNQQKGDTAYNELFFIRKRNPSQEQWTGRRLGVEGVKSQLGFRLVYNGEDFKNFPIDFTKFKQVIYDVIPDDVRSGTLSTLIKTFRDKAGISKLDNKYVMENFRRLANGTTPSNLAARVSRIKTSMAEVDDNDFKTNPILLELINKPDSITLASVINKIKSDPLPANEYSRLTSSLREIKTADELALLRKSVFLSAIAHKEIMKAIHPKMSETELQGIFEYIHMKYGAEGEGYPPIVGAGANGCILHYGENNVTEVKNTLVLMDVASEYHGYSADITRTVPANGKFTLDQKAIYQVVYDAQEEVFKLCKEGTPFSKLNEKATEVLADGLLKLGVISNKKDVSKYYIHGVSHHMGLDVHDKNITPVLKENMVITVEPGIYIPKGSPCDPKWWDIAVRIEDDVVIGKTNCENLSIAAPRKIEEIEKLAKEKSVFDEVVLPKFK
ncbi:MAG: aminopeptidase P N-terminal domain-containing protein [Bacteroidota bacterium]